mmetsp:Transcript_103074/g.315345  ORF Transcript_103074/g.315345 Transcript_103074/m.315345 type:complete len:214 (+) Transcript_103074:478-1119(+)
MISIGRTSSATCKTPRQNSARSMAPEPSVSIRLTIVAKSWRVYGTLWSSNMSATLGKSLFKSAVVASSFKLRGKSSKSWAQHSTMFLRVRSRSVRWSSSRMMFFSNIASLMTPVNKAIMPKLPKMTKITRKPANSGRPLIRSWYSTRLGCTISSNKENMAWLMVPNRRAKNAWSASSSGRCPNVLTKMIAQKYNAPVSKHATQKTATAAKVKP